MFSMQTYHAYWLCSASGTHSCRVPGIYLSPFLSNTSQQFLLLPSTSQSQYKGRLCEILCMTIFNKTVISQCPQYERSKLLIDLVLLKTNRSQRSGERAVSRRLGPGISCEEGLQTKQKDHRSLLNPT